MQNHNKSYLKTPFIESRSKLYSLDHYSYRPNKSKFLRLVRFELTIMRLNKQTKAVEYLQLKTSSMNRMQNETPKMIESAQLKDVN